MGRRLTTILSADVAGFSHLMGADEERTLGARFGSAATSPSSAVLSRRCGPLSKATPADSVCFSISEAAQWTSI